MTKNFWQVTPSNKELRSFSLIVGNLALILLVVGILKASLFLIILFASILFVLVVGQLVRSLLILFYRLWMSLTQLMGAFMSRLILSLIFYLIFTPISLILKLLRKQPLDLRIDKSQSSYWIARSQANSDLTKMH